jgi:hypothetical protein
LQAPAEVQEDPMFELKSISRESIPRCLAKAERYRLLNEPREAESICRDIVRIDPENQGALTTLLLSLTDQFGDGVQGELKESLELLARLSGDYEKAYFRGVIYERWAKAQLAHGILATTVYDWICEAMSWYEKAEALSPPGNEDAVLRWNTCARTLDSHPELQPMQESAGFGD